jgi:glycosyltransferase involved in cell wall biosynthesis
MPTYQSERFLEPVLASLAAQTYPNLEILISDDASSDRTIELCEAFVAGRSNATLIRQPKNLGWIGNSNFLLESARSTFAFFAFHDDVLQPHYVEKLVSALEKRPEAALAFSDLLVTEPNGRATLRRYTEIEEQRSPAHAACTVLSEVGQWWIPVRGVFRLSAAHRVGGFRRHRAGEFSADWPWLLHMAATGHFVRVPAVLCAKNFRRASLSVGWPRSIKNRIAVNLALLNEVRRTDLTLITKLAMHLYVVGRIVTMLARGGLNRLVRLARRGEVPGNRDHRPA